MWLDVGAVDDVRLETALVAVLEYHDALRLRFRRTETGWAQWYGPAVGMTLERQDLSALPADEQDRVQEGVAASRQTSLDLEHGPVGRAVLFDRGAGGRRLLVILHHLVVDGVSWRILRDDVERACAQLERGEPIDLGEKSTSYQQWAESLARYAASEQLAEERAYWLAQRHEGVGAVPVDG